MIQNKKAPEEPKRKKTTQTKVNRTPIDEAHGATNKLNRAKRAARNSIKNAGKDGNVICKPWKRKNGPARERRNRRRERRGERERAIKEMIASPVVGDVFFACAQ